MLYSDESEWKFCANDPHVVPKITKTELQEQLRYMKNGKCPDRRGMVAEVLKESGPVMLEAICQLFMTF